MGETAVSVQPRYMILLSSVKALLFLVCSAVVSVAVLSCRPYKHITFILHFVCSYSSGRSRVRERGYLPAVRARDEKEEGGVWRAEARAP